MDEHGFARDEAALAKRVVCGDVHLGGGAGLLPREVRRDLHGQPEVGDHLFGIAAAGEEAHHAVAHGEPLNTCAHREDLAGVFETRDFECGFRAGLRVTSLPLEQVSAVERGGPDADEQILRPGDGVRDLLHLEDLGTTRFRDDDSAHGGHPRGIRSFAQG